MLKKEAKSMMESLTEDKEKFEDFHSKGYFSYENESYKGNAAITEKDVISFLEDLNDRTKSIATINFQNGGTFVYELYGDDYSFSRFGKDPTVLTDTAKVYFPTKEQVMHDINTIHRHCEESKEKAFAIEKAYEILEKFRSISIKANNQISSEDALLSLQNTLNALTQSKEIEDKEFDNR